MNINLTLLRDEMIKGWKQEFGPTYFNFFIDRGHIIGVKHWGSLQNIKNNGDLENVELRIASKYEITINDCWYRVHAVMSV